MDRMPGSSAYVAGTFDTKGDELEFVCDLLKAAGVHVVRVDLSTRPSGGTVEVAAAEVAACHPEGTNRVFLDDRGAAVTAMSVAFAHFVAEREDIGGLIGLGGSGGTALLAPAMRALPIGAPKVLVSTVASGEVGQYVGASDITMMYSVTDVAGLNRISRRVLGNAAHALAGMMRHGVLEPADAKPAIGLTMFGVTTTCVTQVRDTLRDEFDCLVFHATGAGGKSMEKLIDSGAFVGVIDVTTTEVCDLLMGGVFSAGEDRLGAVIRSRIPYVGSCGALDMVNFGALDTVPERYKSRKLHVHNPQVTLMRTSVEENARMGEWIGAKLNACEGSVRFLLPEGGVSALDAPGQAFHDPEADAALFGALEATVRQTDRRRLVRLPLNVNDKGFAVALVEHFREIHD